MQHWWCLKKSECIHVKFNSLHRRQSATMDTNKHAHEVMKRMVINIFSLLCSTYEHTNDGLCCSFIQKRWRWEGSLLLLLCYLSLPKLLPLSVVCVCIKILHRSMHPTFWMEEQGNQHCRKSSMFIILALIKSLSNHITITSHHHFIYNQQSFKSTFDAPLSSFFSSLQPFTPLLWFSVVIRTHIQPVMHDDYVAFKI